MIMESSNSGPAPAPQASQQQVPPEVAAAMIAAGLAVTMVIYLVLKQDADQTGYGSNVVSYINDWYAGGKKLGTKKRRLDFVVRDSRDGTEASGLAKLKDGEVVSVEIFNGRAFTDQIHGVLPDKVEAEDDEVLAFVQLNVLGLLWTGRGEFGTQVVLSRTELKSLYETLKTEAKFTDGMQFQRWLDAHGLSV